jgi:predicted metal-dependent phosphoesterase TrpH
MARKLFRPVEAIELMLSAGVVPVLAHPFTLNLEEGQMKGFLADLAAAGLRGIEGYHGDLAVEDQEIYRDMGRSHGLVVTGGSDYHGDMRPDRELPGGRCGVTVPDEVVDELRAARAVLDQRD